MCMYNIYTHSSIYLTHVDRLEEGVQGGERHQQVGVEVDAFADGGQREHEGGGALMVLMEGAGGVSFCVFSRPISIKIYIHPPHP